MVFSGEPTEPDSTTTTTSDGTTDDLTAFETAERVSTMLAPFLDVLTVLVQALTAYTLIKRIPQ